jgi:hypothetical protein
MAGCWPWGAIIQARYRAHTPEEAEGGLSRKTLILFVWLIIGAAAAGQRGYFGNVPATCSAGATIAATMVTGPLNYLGVDPQITCNWPTPSPS